MADTKLTALPLATVIANGDLLYLVHDPAGAPVSQKAMIGQIVATVPPGAGAHASTHGSAGSDPILSLKAGIQIVGVGSIVILYDSLAPAGSRTWRLSNALDLGLLHVEALDDNLSTIQATPLKLARNGNVDIVGRVLSAGAQFNNRVTIDGTANTPYSQLEVMGGPGAAHPAIILNDVNKPVNEKKARILYKDQQIKFDFVSDDENTNVGTNPACIIARNGSVDAGGSVYATNVTARANLYERNRAPAVGEWIAYTPIWAASGVAPAIGNGSLSGTYAVIGKTVFVYIALSSGSTTTFGSGMWTFTLPYAPLPPAVYAGAVLVHGPPLFSGIPVSSAWFLGGAPYIGAFVGSGAINSGHPITWAANNYLFINAIYQMA